MSDPVETHEDLDEGLDDVDDDIDDDESSTREEVEAFRDAVTASADQTESIANAQIAATLVQDVVAAAKKGATNPLEAISRPNPAPRLDALAARRDAVLAAATDDEVGAAHALFVERVFGQNVSAAPPADRGALCDRLLTEMIHRIRGEAMPPSGDPQSDAYVQTLVDTWGKVDDKTFWESMASEWDDSPITADEAKSHLLFLRTAGDLTPPAEAKETYIWRTAATKLAAVEKIAAAGGAAPDPNAVPPGTIDIAAMYRQAANSTSMGKPVPREIATELVRLALADLVGGARQVAGRRVAEPIRETLTRRLRAETVPPGADQTTTKAVSDRNATRAAAADVLKTTFATPAKDSRDKTGVDTERALSDSSMAENYREGRHDLGEVFQHLSDYLDLALERVSGGSSEAKRISDVASKSGLADSLARWSALYAAGSADSGAIRDALGDIKIRAKSIVDSIAESSALDPVSQLTFAMRMSVDAAGVEVARQALELIAAANGGPKADGGTPLGGARDALETTSSRGRARRLAVAARERLGGLGEFATKTLKAYNGVPWAEAIKTAAAAWTTADQTDVPTMVQASATFATALDAARKTLAGASNGERYIGGNVIDAIAFAAMDRITRLAATGGEVTDADRDALVKALSTSTPPPVAPTDLTTAWSKGKDTIAGKLPSGLTLDLTGRIKAWSASAATNPVDKTVLATRTFSVVQAITDYRTRIDAGNNTPNDKAILLGLLDTVLSSMQARLQALDTV
jgi:hypothetical protein